MGKKISVRKIATIEAFRNNYYVLFVLTPRIKCGTGAKNQKSQGWWKTSKTFRTQ